MFRFYTALILILLTAGFAMPIRGAEFMPPVRNFDNRALGFEQVFSCTRDSAGTMYFAADGLVSFDGVDWEKYPIPNNYMARVVLAHGDRVYIGSYEEFGYFRRDRFGQMVYTSLSRGIDRDKLFNCEFWDIVYAYGKIWFRSYHRLFSYDGSRITEHVYGNNPQHLFECGGRLYCQFYDRGLTEMDSRGRAVLVAGPEDFYGEEIQAHTVLGNGDILLALGTHGLRRYTPGRYGVRPFTTRIDKELSGNKITSVLMSLDSVLYVGTHNNGIYAVDSAGDILWHCHTKNGLGNDAVLRLSTDSMGNIWMVTDGCLSWMFNTMPFSILHPDTDEPYIGDVNDIAELNGRLYLATSQGGFTYDKTTGSISSCGWEDGYMWHATNVGQSLFTGSNDFTNQLAQGGRSCYKHSSTSVIERADGSGMLIESSFDGLYYYNPPVGGSGAWMPGGRVEGLRSSLRQVVQDYDGVMWCSHMASGVLRVVLSKDGMKVLNVKHFRSLESGDNPSLCHILKINGMVVISDGHEMFTYDRNTRELKTFDALRRDLPHIKGVSSATEAPDGAFWLSTSDGFSKIRYDGDHYREECNILLGNGSGIRSISTSKMLKGADGSMYFTLFNSIGRLKDSISQQRVPEYFAAKGISFSNAGGQKVLLPLQCGEDTVPEVDGNICFRFALPGRVNDADTFEYTLEGGGNTQHVFSTTPEKSYVGLPPGDYTFTARMVDNRGNASEDFVYVFTVPRPLLQSPWVMALYFILIAAFTIAIARWQLKRAARRSLEAIKREKTESNLKILEQQRIIDEQQKQLLQQQLQDKTTELTNMALDNVSQSKIMEELRETLQRQRNGESTGGGSEVDAMLRKLSSGVGDKEFWDIFHRNFDLIHQNYFTNLRKEFPTLTSVDLRFCALLRFNMSTKDITNFTNLSVRGVESARYRLRKKLGLKSNESLVQFLVDFSMRNMPEA